MMKIIFGFVTAVAAVAEATPTNPKRVTKRRRAVVMEK
jgi:hypothetical protein